MISVHHQTKPLFGRSWILDKFVGNQEFLKKCNGTLVVTDFGVLVRMIRQDSEHGANGHVVTPNVRGKPAPTAWRAGQVGENVPRTADRARAARRKMSG